MKTSFLKLGKTANWFDIGKNVLDNLESFTDNDYEFISSQLLAKEDMIPEGKGRLDILPFKIPIGRDLRMDEITRIYKSNGKYFVHDNDSTKGKLRLSKFQVRVIDIPYLKGYNTHKKLSPKTKFVCPEKMF